MTQKQTKYLAKNNKNRYELRGLKFARLFVLDRSGVDNHNNTLWSCLCDCGKIVYITSHRLIANVTKSCGCWNSECASMRNRTHGESLNYKASKIYTMYAGAKRRAKK